MTGIARQTDRITNQKATINFKQGIHKFAILKRSVSGKMECGL